MQEVTSNYPPRLSPERDIRLLEQPQEFRKICIGLIPYGKLLKNFVTSNLD